MLTRPRVLGHCAVLAGLLSLGAWAKAGRQETHPGKESGEPALRYSLSDRWKPQTDWPDPSTEEPGARPLRPRSCRSWLDSQTLAALRICEDRNWLTGKSQAEVEKVFLGEFELGRTFLAENLMGFFFSPPHRFYGEAAKLLREFWTGQLGEEDIKKSLLGYARDQTRFALLARLEPLDAYEAYSAGLSPGQVLTKDVKSHSVDVDVDFASCRAASLGSVEFAGRKWLAFLLVEDRPVSKDWIRLLGPAAADSRMRFLWLVGGGRASFNDAETLRHLVVADLWNGHSRMRTLEGLEQTASAPAAGGAISAPQPLSHRHPRTWIINDESWKAKLGETVIREVPDAVVVRYDFVTLLNTLPPGRDSTSGRDLPASEAQLTRLLEAAPDATDLHYALGWVLNGEKRPDDALPHFQKVLELDPEHPLVYFDLGVSYSLKREVSKAETSYKVALARYPEFTEAKLNLCGLYQSTEDAANVEPACSAALEAAPNNPGLLNNIAWFMVTAKDPALRDPPKGLELARRAVSITNERVPGFLDTLAEAYYVNGKIDEAVQTELKALAMDPENAEFKARLEKYRKEKDSKHS